MRNKRHAKRVRRLAIMCTMSTIILVASTYAWFIGMKTVNVSSFDVEIATTEGLSLSLNGKDWDYTVTINSDNFDDEETVYVGNTNTWSTKGLIPMSTVGIVDSDASRLIMYEKGSLTTSPGGYRLMASRVDNYSSDGQNGFVQGDGYVAFDLFIRNLSGEEYYVEDDVLNEEAIYLTTNSTVSVVTTGADQAEKTGIENSVRVAFAQIGRVQAVKENTINDPTKVAQITGITCTDTYTGLSDKNGVTGICRNAQIWEPNDTKHVANAIGWYNTACRARSGADITATGSYSGTCGTVENGTAYNTYAVSGVIDYLDEVDVYDGADYNGYNASVSATPANGKLLAFDYFTDTEKNLTGTARPTFITLAPNSITKVRVYVYIEGQDVDNYDFASLGKKISVNFGFTKDRFTAEDINYDGPMNGEEVNVPSATD